MVKRRGTILKAYAVACYASAKDLGKAREVQTYKGDTSQFCEGYEIGKIKNDLEGYFGCEVPFAVENYSTEYAEPLYYMYSSEYGIGGRPNCILALGDDGLALAQVRKSVGEIEILHSTALHMILSERFENIKKKFKQKQRGALSEKIYFLMPKAVLQTKVCEKNIETITAAAEELRGKLVDVSV